MRVIHIKQLRTFDLSAAIVKYTAGPAVAAGTAEGPKARIFLNNRAPTAVLRGQAGASALLVIGVYVGDLRAGLASLVLRGWLV
jgi:hypothetical protein